MTKTSLKLGGSNPLVWSLCGWHSFGSAALGAIDSLGPPTTVGLLHLALGLILKLMLMLYLAFMFYFGVLPSIGIGCVTLETIDSIRPPGSGLWCCAFTI